MEIKKEKTVWILGVVGFLLLAGYLAYITLDKKEVETPDETPPSFKMNELYQLSGKVTRIENLAVTISSQTIALGEDGQPQAESINETKTLIVNDETKIEKMVGGVQNTISIAEINLDDQIIAQTNQDPRQNQVLTAVELLIR